MAKWYANGYCVQQIRNCWIYDFAITNFDYLSLIPILSISFFFRGRFSSFFLLVPLVHFCQREKKHVLYIQFTKNNFACNAHTLFPFFFVEIFHTFHFVYIFLDFHHFGLAIFDLTFVENDDCVTVFDSITIYCRYRFTHVLQK